ncbi:MAG: ribosomal L7Ae/L30e/S12e/Gadd45 family protein [Saccharofermentans sp.]|nr:ribosomal L7Ae/L30e/S12e/Gadd45 family protein [Saccharofermentans sp.]
MTTEDKILGFIGLAMRAGKVASGYDMALSAISGGQAKLLILSKDISRNTLGKLLKRLESDGIEAPDAYSFSKASRLGDAIGKPDRAVIAITDEGFAKKLSTMLEEYDDTKETD